MRYKRLYFTLMILSSTWMFAQFLTGCATDTPHASISQFDACETDLPVREVFDVVLRDFSNLDQYSDQLILTNTDDNSVIMIDVKVKGRLRNEWHQLKLEVNRAKWEVGDALIDDLAMRNQNDVIIQGLIEGSRRYRFADLAKVKSLHPNAPGNLWFWKEFPNSPCYLTLRIPGFSDDRKQALVTVDIGQPLHFATGMYWLLHGKDGWRIREKRFCQY